MTHNLISPASFQFLAWMGHFRTPNTFRPVKVLLILRLQIHQHNPGIFYCRFDGSEMMVNDKNIFFVVIIYLKKVTASRPSTRRWSYVKAMYIIGRMTTCPCLTTGLSKTPCIPRMADWGGLMIGNVILLYIRVSVVLS